MFVYKITNKVNDKIYVGQATQVLDQRIEQHTRATIPLGKDIKKYWGNKF